MAGPAFAVVRAGEEMVDDFGEGVGGLIFFKGLDCGEGGREAGEIEVGAADEIAFGGRLVGREFFGIELGGDEVVEGRGGPLRVLHRWESRFGDGQVGPEFALLRGDGVVALGDGDVEFRPEGTVLDPFLEERDFGGGNFCSAERHLHFVVGVFDGLDEEALVRVAGDDGGAGFAAFEEAVAGGHGEAAERGCGVATEAAVGEDGADLELEMLGLVGRGGC